MKHTVTAAKQDNWPEWLRVFDQSNDQHGRIKDELGPIFDRLGKKMPPAWLKRDTINVLELACGDGTLSDGMLRRMLTAFPEKKIRYFGLELNPAAAAQANEKLAKIAAEFAGRFDGSAKAADLSDGKGDIAEGDLKAKLPQGFTPDLSIMSHAMYFTEQKEKLMRKIADVGHKDSVAIYMMNSALSKLVPDDMNNLGHAIAFGPESNKPDSLHSILPSIFKSRINMPATNPEVYIERFRQNPDAEGLPPEGVDMHHLLSFMAQKNIGALTLAQRNALLDDVTERLREAAAKGIPNAIEQDNQIYLAFHPERDHATKQSFLNAVSQVGGYGAARFA